MPARRSARGRWLLGTVVVATLAGATATGGVAAIRHLLFGGLAPIGDADLADLRGGFTLPKLPDIKINFGFRIETSVNLPDLPSVGSVPTPTLTAVVNSVPPAPVPGPEIASVTTVNFDDPTQAVVVSTDTRHGAAGATSERVVDLTQETLTLEVGDPSGAVVTHEIDADQVTTTMRSVISDVDLTSRIELDLTIEGVPALQSKLPSVGAIRSMRAVQDAVTMSLR